MLLLVGQAGAAELRPDAGVGAWIDARLREQRDAGAGAAPGRRAQAQQIFRERGPGGPELQVPVPASLSPLIRAVRSSVVNLKTTLEEDGTSGEGRSAGQSTGSGFIIHPDGYVVTNNHVVERAEEIRVTLVDGRQYKARVVGRDRSTDLALLQLTGTARNLPFAYFGDSDRLEVGDWVVAIGNPFGLDHSVSHGMISAKERVIGVGLFDDFIQTDALINPGNSGGPLFNMKGEVVGVTTAVATEGQGIGFAVPINMVKDLLPNLLENGRLERGWLGLNIRESAGNQKGAVVVDVFPGSPAAEAGLQAGDRILSVNGRQVESYLQILRRVAILAPGTEIKLHISREAVEKDLVVKLAERPSAEPLRSLASAGRVEGLGILLRELGENLAARLKLAPGAGLFVVSVLPGSTAEQAGIKAGDLVTEVNRKRTRDLKALSAVLAQSPAEQPLVLKVRRGETSWTITLAPP